MKVLRARRRPLGIAARAIVRSGKGHKYWDKFPSEAQTQLEQLAGEVHSLLFDPQMPKGTIRTLDLPMGGEAYAAQSLPLVLDFIEVVNIGIDIEGDDPDGTRTIQSIQQCKRIAELIDSNDPGSLGLHPIVYFYAQNGRHKPASFYAITALAQELEHSKRIDSFIRVRADFEALLIENDYIVQQIVRGRRGAAASVERLRDFYLRGIDLLNSGLERTEVIAEIVRSGEFGPLSVLTEEAAAAAASKGFSRNTKSAAFIRQALEGAVRCAICHGYVHRNGMSFDHRERRQDGGTNTIDNAQVTHPYCNTGFKERQVSQQRISTGAAVSD